MNERWVVARPWVGTVVRLFLGAVWIWAAVSKLGQPRTFLQAVRAYDATPEWLSKAIGYGLPVLELCLGILLVIGVTVRIAAAVSGLLYLVFLIGLIQASARGIKLECGCFGGGGATDGATAYTLDILRDVGLLILAVYLVVWAFTRISVEEYLARNDSITAPSAKRMRTDQGRKKYEAQVAMAKAQARTRSLYVDSSLIIVVILVSVIGIGVQSGRAKIQGSVTATNATVANGVVYGKKAAATVDVYEDFGCPNCLNFEKSAHETLNKDVQANLIQLRFHTIAILDSGSPNQYSTRAANAALCASDVGVDHFVDYHNLLYGTSGGKQVQPTEGTAGPTDTQLISYAKSLKYTTAQINTFTSCVTDQTHKALVQALTDRASQDGVNGTPTIKVNGTTLKNYDLATVTAAIKAADAKGPAPSPSVTPSPSASSTSSSASSSPSTPASSGSSTP